MRFEREGLEITMMFLDKLVEKGKILGYTSIPFEVDREFQFHCGDWAAELPNGKMMFIESKAEENHTGNLYIETWSHKSLRTPEFPNGRRGWFYNLDRCHAMYYSFLNIRPQRTYLINMPLLRKFDMSPYPEKPQGKNVQVNDTYGICIPAEDLRKAGVVRSFALPRVF